MALIPSPEADQFYLGRDLGADGETPFYLRGRNLTTHGVCIGMTGSGKTGVCIALLEEAAVNGIPMIAIDPKGDLTNLALAFPETRPSDFQPWIDPAEVDRTGKTIETLATEKAEAWRKGWEDWGITTERVLAMKQRIGVTIFTPGSSAGEGLSVLQAFDAPEGEFDDEAETYREEIAGGVSALLEMLNIEADPVRSREHILLCQIIETKWRTHERVALVDLVSLVQNPPLQNFGALSLDAFFPGSERVKLATSINNLLASPAFAGWLTGTPLDVERLLKMPDGRPRVSIITLAHLGDAERMFVTTLLLNQVISWVRRQSGTSSLRALLYFDEVFGYLPPHPANPPSKKLVLTLLKQARAFGLGTVLVTQNPVDLDYKALSNCGTWLIGRLQTEQDRARILDGLSGAASEQGATFSRGDLDKQLGTLKTRQFLVHSARDGISTLIESRWVMSYLAGPLTRAQIRKLRESSDAPEATKATNIPVAASGPPPTPPGWPVLFSSENTGTLRAHLLVELEAEYTDRQWIAPMLRSERLLLALTDPAPTNWAASVVVGDPSTFWEQAPSGATFAPAPAVLQNERALKPLLDAAGDHVARTAAVVLWEQKEFKLRSLPDETREAFTARVAEAAIEAAEASSQKALPAVAKKISVLREKMERDLLALQNAKEMAAEQSKKKWIGLAGDVLGSLLGGKKRRGSLITKTRVNQVLGGNATERRSDDRAETIELRIRQQQAELSALELEASKLQVPALSDGSATTGILETRILPTRSRVKLVRKAVVFA